MSSVDLGIPKSSVGSTVARLSDAYCKLIKDNMKVTLFPSVMLWGPPGVGKSQGVRQIAKNIEEETGKKVVVTDVRLLLFNPIDLRGIPTANEDKTLAVWLKPKIFQMDESDDVINILFLDEISAAPPSVQASAYQITLDRTVGEHKLPDNCIVIAAGNRVTDQSVATKMPKALANRMMHMDIECSFDSWRQWAILNGINKKIIGFLSFAPKNLMGEDLPSECVAFPTPRSWEMVSNVLNYISDDVFAMSKLISGLIGTGVYTAFNTWVKVYKDLPNVEDIFKGKDVPVPRASDALYALISSMLEYARKNKDNMQEIANSIRYANKFPPDFAAVLVKDYCSIEKDYKLKLFKIPEVLRFIQTKGSMLNGNI